jgi:hypothetical protein
MRRDGWFVGQSLCEPFEGRNTGMSSSRRCAPGGDMSLQTIWLLLPLACCRHYCRPTFGHIDRRASSRG